MHSEWLQLYNVDNAYYTLLILYIRLCHENIICNMCTVRVQRGVLINYYLLAPVSVLRYNELSGYERLRDSVHNSMNVCVLYVSNDDVKIGERLIKNQHGKEKMYCQHCLT